MVSDLHRNVLLGTDGQYSLVSVIPYLLTAEYSPSPRLKSGQLFLNTRGFIVLLLHSIPSGELPPPPPRTCFGRDELVEKIVGLAKNLTPIALIGPGGIGKTSIALAVLHHNQIRKQFGYNRWFIHCDQFPASCANFLNQLSKVIGAGIENPEGLTPLRPFLSSRQMILFLDNAESILDSQGTTSQEIYTMVEELSQFSNICLCITSRISTVPPNCRCLDIPILSMDAACCTFYHIYNSSEQSNLVNNILEQLDFHPLSITLLATVAHHNKWGINRLTREWGGQRTGILHTQHNKSLAATIELSLASPTFQGLGPDACDLLGVVAFFPQGINENNLDWLFPNISNKTTIFDKFCTLSLTYQSNGFIMMLAPLRDHLCPKDPTSSPLLCMTKDYYFHRLSVDVYPDKPGYKEAQWITLEDINVEHLLNVFTTLDASSVDVWAACCNFIKHLFQHKPRPVILGPKIEGLPDDHPSKPQCLSALSQLFCSVGNYMEHKQLLISTLRFQRERGDNSQVAEILVKLAESDRQLGLQKEGVRQAKEALGIYKQLDDTLGQARSWRSLALLFCDDKQLNAAEEAASQALNLLPDQGEQFQVCQCHRVLGSVYRSKSEAEKAIKHLEIALSIASSFDWHREQFWIHFSLAKLFFRENSFDTAENHIKCAKLYTINNLYGLGCMMELQANIWYQGHRFEEAKSEVLYATNVLEKVGATKDVEVCRKLLQKIEVGIEKSVTSSELDFNGELLEIILLPIPINSQFLAQGPKHRLTSLFRHILP